MGKNQFSALFLGISSFLILFGLVFAVKAEVGNSFPEGSLIKSTKSLVYYVGNDAKLHPYTTFVSFHSWNNKIDKISVVNEAIIRNYEIGAPVCVKPGTWLLSFRGIARVYAVEPGCVLRPLRSETEAALLYGSDWAKRVVKLDPIDGSYYTVKGFGLTDKKDLDADGVDYDTEIKFGSSDSDEDTDHDGVSDYEEINFWNSDPRNDDTDNDDVFDGQEIQNSYSPTGSLKFSSLPAGYILPRGSNDGGSLFSQKSPYRLNVQKTESSYNSNRPNIWKSGKLLPL